MESVIEKINFKEIVPILIKGDAFEEERGGLFVVENAEEFIEKCIALGIKSLFLRRKVFSNEDFIIESSNVFSDDDDEDVNITSYDQSLNEYKQYWGTVCAISFTVSINDRNVIKIVKESWYELFEEKKEIVCNKIDNEQEELINKMELESEREEEEYNNKKELLIAEMWKLISASEFCKIPTQKAKLEFALEKIEDLEFIEYDDLRKEMQQINARIVARGLNKR
jgi:hypothetical protein